MHVESLTLCGFRNYGNASLNFSPETNIITGRNAQGKTNLLEAVYYLAGGRSFRTRFDREVIGFNADFAEIRAGVRAEDRGQDVRILMQRARKKQIWLNGVKKTGTELSGSLKAVIFCPEDLNLIRAGAAERRHMMDLAISQLRPGYANLLAEFTRTLENKTRLLKDDYSERMSGAVLDAFSENMARIGAQMIRYRAAYAQRLAAEAAPIHADFSGTDEELAVAYTTVSSVTDPTASAQTIYEQLAEHYLRHRAAEIASMSCLSGIHKDDLLITVNGQSARTYASQGQTRTAALSLKLAEREIFLQECGEYPVLLLDDVLSELDARRQAFVLNRIGGGQTLITCCEGEEIVGRTGGHVLFIENGQVRE